MSWSRLFQHQPCSSEVQLTAVCVTNLEVPPQTQAKKSWHKSWHNSSIKCVKGKYVPMGSWVTMRSSAAASTRGARNWAGLGVALVRVSPAAAGRSCTGQGHSSKTDHEGQGKTTVIPQWARDRPIARLGTWLGIREGVSGPLLMQFFCFLRPGPRPIFLGQTARSRALCINGGNSSARTIHN